MGAIATPHIAFDMPREFRLRSRIDELTDRLANAEEEAAKLRVRNYRMRQSMRRMREIVTELERKGVSIADPE